MRKKDKKLKHLPVTLTCFTQMEPHSFVPSISFPTSVTFQVAHEGGEMLDYGSFVTLPLCPSFLLRISPCSRVRILPTDCSPLGWVHSIMGSLHGPQLQKFALEWALHRLQRGYFFWCGPLHALEGNLCSTLVLSMGYWRKTTFLGAPTPPPSFLTLLFIGLFLWMLGSIFIFFFLFFSFCCIIIEIYYLDCDIQLCCAMGPLEPSGTTCVQHWAHPDPFSKMPPLQLSPVTKTLQNNVNQIHKSTDK